MSTHSAAEKAARKLRSWVANRTTVHRAAPQLSERHLTDVIQGAIDEATAALVANHKSVIRFEVKKATAAQQARIEKLEAALREFVAGAWVTKDYEAKCCRHCAAQTTFPNHYIGCPIPEANDALAPVERGGDANAAR